MSKQCVAIHTVYYKVGNLSTDDDKPNRRYAMDVQFTSHAIERVCGRLSAVVSYGEVQSTLLAKQLRNGDNRVLVKVLDHTVRIQDTDAINGKVEGDKVYALCTVRDGGCRVDTIALSY